MIRFWRTRIGMTVLGIWLVAQGLLGLVPALQFSGSGTLLALLALAAGVLILLDR
jgi:hypothetical protein